MALIAASLTACAGNSDSESGKMTASERSVTEAEEASEWDGTSVVYGEKFYAQIFDEGSLVLDLDANATTGYTWVITEETDIFASDYNTYVEPDNTSRRVGAGGIAEFHIIALKEGTGTMVFQYKRPWEGGEVAGTYALTLTISRNQSVLQINSVSFEQIN
ncbi:MAG: protease inhibitor I42 family protein [Clostridiales bacterium]|nr:protease inhibitor I42 family protein [Clostridiales bacterium]